MDVLHPFVCVTSSRGSLPLSVRRFLETLLHSRNQSTHAPHLGLHRNPLPSLTCCVRFFGRFVSAIFCLSFFILPLQFHLSGFLFPLSRWLFFSFRFLTVFHNLSFNL